MRVALLVLVGCGFPRPDEVVATDAIAPPTDVITATPDMAQTDAFALTSFSLDHVINGLPHDVLGKPAADGFDLDVFGAIPTTLTPSFTVTDGAELYLAGVKQMTGASPATFTTALTYELRMQDAQPKTYVVRLHRRVFTVFATPVNAIRAIAIGNIGTPHPGVVVVGGTVGGPGGLAAFAATTDKPTRLAQVSTLTLANTPDTVALTDRNGDHLDDAIIGGTNVANTTYLANPGGVFAPSNVDSQFPKATALVGGSFNGDLSGDYAEISGTTAVVGMTPAGGGTSNQTTIDLGVTLSSLAVLNKHDLAVAGPAKTYVYPSSTTPGGATFAYELASVRNYTATGRLSIGDLDANGTDDLLIAYTGAPSTLDAVFDPVLSNGAKVSVTAFGNTRISAACAVDLDGDGRADPVVVFAVATGKVTIGGYVSGAGHSFMPPPMNGGTFNDTGVIGCATADLDGDGRPELVVAGVSNLATFSLVDL